MSAGYFTKKAVVRLKNGQYEIRITTSKSSWISDMKYYDANDVRTDAEKIAYDSESDSATYRMYTSDLSKRLKMSPFVVPMGYYPICDIVFDLNSISDVSELYQDADKTELNIAVNKAEDIVAKVEESRNIYTADSYEALTTALESAKKVSALAVPKQAEVDAATAALNSALDSLVIDESKKADKTILEEALTDAKALGKGNHTETNWNALQDAIADAQAVYDDIYASTKEANAAARSLNTAVTMFNSSGEASELDPANLEDGVYTAYVDMVNASNKDQKSMSDGAITKPVTITVRDGGYTVTANFHGIYVTLGDTTMFGYMRSLRYWDGEDYKDVTVDSCYDVVDEFNKAEGYRYPHQVTFPLVNRSAGDDADGHVRLQVFVPIMEGISAGSGTQDALMRIDWTSLAEGDEAANEAVKAEAARNELGQVIADAKNIGNDKGAYTAASYRALTDAIAEAERLVKSGTATAAELKAANAKVEAARKALPKGKTFTVSGITYEVTDAARRHVTATKVSTSKKGLTINTARYKGTGAHKAGAYKVTALAKGAVRKAGKLARLTLGANVASIGAKAFAKAKRLTNLTVKSRRLTEKSVKGCLKGSKVKTVKVPKAKRRAYRKIFTERVAGGKVAVR